MVVEWDINPPENEGVGSDMIEHGCLFLLDGFLESPNILVGLYVDSEGNVRMIAENPAVEGDCGG
jgi:hypothetical protein